MDRIILDGLTLSTRIGVPEAERRTPQPIGVDIELLLDTRGAGSSDDIAQSIDYDRVIARIRELEGIERNTLEKLAEDIATTLLGEFPVRGCRVTVRKHSVPGIRSAGVTVERP